MKYDKAIEFMIYEYNKTMDYHCDEYMDRIRGVARVLDELGYGLEHRITALFRFMMNDTDATSADLLKYSSMDVLEALKLLQEPRNCEKIKYLYNIKGNMLAFPVKMAEHLYDLRNRKKKKKKEIEALIHESEDYYLKCAHDTIFYEPMFMELVKCKTKVGVY